MWTTSPRASSRCKLRTMLMIGVIPLPALMKSNLLRRWIRQHEGAFDPAEPDDVPRPGATRQIGRDLARIDELRSDADAAVGPLGL